MTAADGGDRPSQGAWRYRIRVRGHLDRQWAERVPGVRLDLEPGGDSVLTGDFADQSALHAVLRWIRDLGAPLLSVERLPLPDEAGPSAGPSVR